MRFIIRMKAFCMKKYKVVNTLNIGDVLVQTIIWVLLTVFTLGLALPFFVYYFFKLILNTTEVYELDCTYDDYLEAMGGRQKEGIQVQYSEEQLKQNAADWSK